MCPAVSPRDSQKEESNSIHVKGFNLVAEIKHAKHGSTILVKNNIVPQSMLLLSKMELNFCPITLDALIITSVYKPPPVKLNFPINFFYFGTKSIIIGDLNSYNHLWGYGDTDENGSVLEEWKTVHNLHLSHDPKLPPPMFNSCQ